MKPDIIDQLNDSKVALIAATDGAIEEIAELRQFKRQVMMAADLVSIPSVSPAADLAAIRLVLDAFDLDMPDWDDSGTNWIIKPKPDAWRAALKAFPTCAQVRAALVALTEIERMAEETK